MRRTATILAALAASIAMGIQAAPASAHLPFQCSAKQSALKELRCGKRDLYIARSELTWLRKNPEAGSIISRVLMYADHIWLKRYARVHIVIAAKRLQPPWPPHHAGWMCIHGGEGDWNDRDSGGNGHWGGLQMHPGWGYGTSYHASDDSQLTQEWAAERGYRASRYSSAWLQGQWGQTIGPCWKYF